MTKAKRRTSRKRAYTPQAPKPARLRLAVNARIVLAHNEPMGWIGLQGRRGKVMGVGPEGAYYYVLLDGDERTRVIGADNMRKER